MNYSFLNMNDFCKNYFRNCAQDLANVLQILSSLSCFAFSEKSYRKIPTNVIQFERKNGNICFENILENAKF